MIKRDIEQRLLEKCEVDSNGCWVFTGGRAGAGYGVIWYQGKQRYAHRVAWILYCAPIDDGMLVLHTCDNPPCCNPDHLFVGTHQDNTDDMIAKGRKPQVGTRKLTQEQVDHIRDLLTNGLNYTEIALQFKVDKSTIYKIKHNLTWSMI